MIQGILNRLAGAGASAPNVQRNANDPRWWGNYAGTMTTAGVHVSEERALQLPVVLNCLNVISQTVAALPLHIYERGPDGTRRRVDNHPLAGVLGQTPNDEHTAYEFFQWMVWQAAWQRNAFAEIVPGARGAVDQLRPLRQVKCERRNGQRVFIVTEDGRQRLLLPEDVWHWKASPLDDDALCGRPVIKTSGESIGRALAVQQYGAAFFANSGISGGIIEAPSFASREQQSEFLAAWREARTGSNAHRDALLHPGMKYHPNMVSNEAAQFIETEKEMAVQMARIWRMPPHKVGIMDRATFSNIESQAIEFVTDTIMPWLVMIEQAISRDLLVAPQRYYAQFNVNGLLRGDTKSRFEAYAQAIQSGWLSPNDVRRLENLDPVPGGETYFRNAALVPLDAPAMAPGAAAASSPAAALTQLRLIEKEVQNDGKEQEQDSPAA